MNILRGPSINGSGPTMYSFYVSSFICEISKRGKQPTLDQMFTLNLNRVRRDY